MSHYPIYGGPFSGRETEESATIYTTRPNLVPPFQSADSAGIELPQYVYDLVANGESKAFLPRDDKDLLAAYQQTSGEHDDLEANALLAEIERRHLDF